MDGGLDPYVSSFNVIQIVVIFLLALVSSVQFTHAMVPVAPAIFVNHGGGPMPLLGDPAHREITVFLRDELKNHVNLKEFKAIILVTAHWEEKEVTISSGKNHDLYFDYYNFPPETYHYKYPAPGHPILAKQIKEVLNREGIPAHLDDRRGWDHGVFVPMMLMNPEADIPIVQMSILSSQHTEQHFKIGEVLSQFRKEGILIIGSGMSYHNMSEFLSKKPSNGVVNEQFDNYLNKTMSKDEKGCKHGLMKWAEQPGALSAHPPGAADHFMPLIVIAGAGCNGKCERIFNWDYKNRFRLSSFIWKEKQSHME